MSIRTLIVDDEALARHKLRTLLDKVPDVEIIGECDEGGKALSIIRDKRPDLVFLDVMMPQKSGIDVAAELRDLPDTHIVVVSAYNHFAFDAFEVEALDYLLKPFDFQRLQKTLHKFRQQQLVAPLLNAQVQRLMEQLHPQPQYLDRLLIRTGSDIFFLRTDQIDWIEAAGNYVYLHAGTKRHLLRETMSNLEKKLDPQKFIRIHRSRIVNVERIKKMQPSSHGEYVIILGDNTELMLTRTYRENLLGRFEMAV